MTHTTLASLLRGIPPAEPKALDFESTLRNLLAPAQPTEGGPITLPLGATARRPEGYVSEAEYLAAVRRTVPMSVTSSERTSHRRWMGYVGTVGAILEAKDRSWQGTAACERQRAKARRAQMFAPNLILGA